MSAVEKSRSVWFYMIIYGPYFVMTMFNFFRYFTVEMFNRCGYLTVQMFNVFGYVTIKMFNFSTIKYPQWLNILMLGIQTFFVIWGKDCAGSRGPDPEGDK